MAICVLHQLNPGPDRAMTMMMMTMTKTRITVTTTGVMTMMMMNTAYLKYISRPRQNKAFYCIK